uniref:RWD domain-containing protein n=1 Tax=Otolemur garnettii TaxID=30611 RepID=H0XZ01_OTOGA
MTDYSKEQRNELEALESIYPYSTVLAEKPPTFTITGTSAGENDDTVQIILKFTYSEKDPDEASLYEIFSQEYLKDNDISDIVKLSITAEENLGVAMIFRDRCARKKKLEREEEKKQNEKETEDAEKQLCHGMPVTTETFLNWKELLEIKKKCMKQEQVGKNKLVGKQLFETDHNLNTSDIQFLEDASSNVKVGESLVQDMDDLELEEDEDDPNCNPADLGSDQVT